MTTSPTPTDAMLHCGVCTTRSKSFVKRFEPCDAKPVKFDSCPRTMFTPTAVRKPVITAVGTKRTRRPPPRSPAMIITIPVMIASV